MRARGRPRWSGMLPGDLVYLYVIGCDKYYKVGIAQNIISRIAGIQSDNPFQITLAMYRTTRHEEAHLVETAVHNSLLEYHVRGEWFCCDLSVIRQAVNRAVRRQEERLPRGQLTDAEHAVIEDAIEDNRLAFAGHRDAVLRRNGDLRESVEQADPITEKPEINHA